MASSSSPRRLRQVLPPRLAGRLEHHPLRSDLIEVVMDLGRRPEARFSTMGAAYEYLSDHQVTRPELDAAAAAVGPFGSDNRSGIPGTLHRISALRNRRGGVVGLTCRVGRAVTGQVEMIRDILETGQSVLFLGRPGAGKTTVIREVSRVLSDDMGRRVVVVDASNEIGGDGDVPHPSIGGARRMQVPDRSRQHEVMVQAVENHTPQVIVVDEVSTEAEAAACRTVAERGVTLIATAHGCFLEDLIKNPSLADLVGGVRPVTLGDEAAAARRGVLRGKKTALERAAPPAFPVVVEMRARGAWVAHDAARSVDAMLAGRVPDVQLRRGGGGGCGGWGSGCGGCESGCEAGSAGAGAGDGGGVFIFGQGNVSISYDQVDDIIAAGLAHQQQEAESGAAAAAAPLAGGGQPPFVVVAEAEAAAAERLLALAAAGGGAARPAAGGVFSGGDGGRLPGADPREWSGWFQQLPEGEAVRHLPLLQYLGASAAGAVRPHGRRSAFAGGSAAAGPGAGAAAGKSKKRARKERR